MLLMICKLLVWRFKHSAATLYKFLPKFRRVNHFPDQMTHQREDNLNIFFSEDTPQFGEQLYFGGQLTLEDHLI